MLETLDGVIKGHAVILDLGQPNEPFCKKWIIFRATLSSWGASNVWKGKRNIGKCRSAYLPWRSIRLDFSSPYDEHAAVVVEAIVRSTGAIPFWIDAETHDRWVAASSHVPFLIANALARSTPLEILPLVGPGFRSTARLAASSSKMMIDVIETNGDNIKQAIERFRECIDRYEYLIERKEWAALELELEHGAEQYQILIGERPK